MSLLGFDLGRLAAQRRRELTPEQEARRQAVDARNAEIQRVGPRPRDGITFGKQPKVRPGGSQSSAAGATQGS